MPRQFTGWPAGAFDVLLRLQGEPARDQRERHRKDREHLVRRPMIALLNDLADLDSAYEDFSVWGFQKNHWWWQHQGGIIRMSRNVEISLRFDLDGLHVRGAWWYPDPAQLARFRAAVADSGRGDELAGVVESLKALGYEITGDVMKRPPRGFPPDHPRSALLRHRSLIAERPLGGGNWIHTAAAVDHVRRTCEDLKPFLSWLTRHVNDARPADGLR
ncbi:DUF2461 family protein [Streptomyces sp. LHD-70]|uniref:DUF2461 family protein n=1 Tax=Streptomyces sp. LHD-70 TaxID=3072140 RepID=UPI00280DA01C|nr:DUF2461 family protein [Streptomyces sp. LHD-70]MDQ8705166.1 DUF2461 family protein [Streptomyces sp. LHD-70]